MSTKKLKLVCYKNSSFRKIYNLVILPCFVGQAFHTYNGKKFELFAISSLCMAFLTFSDFLVSKNIGPIHRKKKIRKK